MIYNYSNIDSTSVDENNVQCDYRDPLGDYLGKVVAVVVPDRTAPIRGRLVRLDTEYLYIERLSGNKTMVHRKTVLRITATHDVKRVV
jgi:hypothetical protein